LAVPVEGAGFWVATEADGAVLVRDTSDWNPLANKEVAREQANVARISVNGALALLLQQTFQSLDQPLMAFFVVRFVRKDDTAIAVNRNAVVGVGKIFRSKPKIERVFGH